MTWELYLNFGLGCLTGIGIGWLLFKRRKPKHDLHSVKKLVYDTGIHQKEAYMGVKELESFFKEISK